MSFTYNYWGGGFGGGFLGNTIFVLQQWGIYDVILPFILIFTVVFGIMEKVKIFEKAGDQKARPQGRKFNAVVSLAIALLVIIPHILGLYPPGQNAVVIINTILPSFAVVAVAVVLMLIILGIGSHSMPNFVGSLISLAAVIFIIFIVFSAYTYDRLPFWLERLLGDPNLIVPIIALLVMGLLFWWLSSPPKESPKSGLQKFMDFVNVMTGGDESPAPAAPPARPGGG